ncbi:glycine C-acetyltransferase [Haloferula sp. A504]|uniref:glycine C-acetyltransferase n=1 Tax=Haloferula sp. A504 TaxID=3373601 RepID=UPI0031C4843D|nr:glycine C-acetyltransferase [Verrucomicrobiaceae bacterium E54]
MTASVFEKRTEETLRGLREAGTLKQLRHVTGPMGPVVRLEDAGEVIVLCANNYLGLANHPEVVEATRKGLGQYGAGTASVRFICGTFDAHRELEQKLADFSGTEAALSYVSCWNANEAAIATAVGPKDVVLSDELNHASIIDSCRLSRPLRRGVFKHRDLDDLREKLQAAAAEAELIWVITDGVFSMEGSVADLAATLELCREFNAMLVVDDSHGVGALGATGKGTAEHCGVWGEIDVITGTLGKALGGAAGGYVAASQRFIDLLVQRSRTSLFSNALPVPVACGATRAVELIQRDTTLIDRLRANTAAIRTGLTDLGFELQDSPSAILPIMIGDEAEAIRKSERLLELGVWVVAFGFPVVPRGEARLRLQVSAALTNEHIERVLAAFAKL